VRKIVKNFSRKWKHPELNKPKGKMEEVLQHAFVSVKDQLRQVNE
jgi:hypothetical protein